MVKTAAIGLLALLISFGASAQPAEKSSSERVRDNPAAQYLLAKTVIGQSIGVVDTRALPAGSEGYNLLKYCWTPANVLGEWAGRAGLTGEMMVRALETNAWARDLSREGYPVGPVNEAIGRYEAALVAAGFTEAARTRALEALVTELEGLRRTAPGAAEIRAIYRCDRQARSLELNYATLPEGGRVRFVPYVLHRFCAAQQLAADDPVRCDYWMVAKSDGPMSFAGETIYSVRWPDGSIATGRFDPDAKRSAGTVTLRRRPPQAAADK
jgi:hypothetical protein